MSKLTRKAIMESFMELLKKKSLDKITVKEIIELADVNRNTFYYHFQDIYDLLEKMFQDESERFQRETPGDSTFYEEYVCLVRLFIDYKEAILNIYQSKSRDVLIDYLESTIRHFISGFVKRAAEGTTLSQAGEEYIIQFYTYAIIGATVRWVERKMPDYRESLIQTVAASFDATINSLIQSYIDGHPEE